jgi:hypothetical protein
MIGLTHSLNCLVLLYSGNVKYCDHDYKRCALAAPDSCDPDKNAIFSIVLFSPYRYMHTSLSNIRKIGYDSTRLTYGFRVEYHHSAAAVDDVSEGALTPSIPCLSTATYDSRYESTHA